MRYKLHREKLLDNSFVGYKVISADRFYIPQINVQVLVSQCVKIEVKSHRAQRKIQLPPVASYCLAESSMSRTSPCRRATSAAGSTSALEPASSSRGLHTRNFSSTGATTEEIAPGDEADNCNRRENKRVTSGEPRVAAHNFANPEISVATVRGARNSAQLNQAPVSDVCAPRQCKRTMGAKGRSGNKHRGAYKAGPWRRPFNAPLASSPESLARMVHTTTHGSPDRPFALFASRINMYNTVIVRP